MEQQTPPNLDWQRAKKRRADFRAKMLFEAHRLAVARYDARPTQENLFAVYAAALASHMATNQLGGKG